METAIAIGIVVLAAAAIGYGLYRSASGKGRCGGCGDGCAADRCRTDGKDSRE